MSTIEIQANEEGRKAIQTICAIALNSVGVQTLPVINQILCAVKPLPPQEAKIEEPKPVEVPVPKKIQKKLGTEDKPCSGV